MQSYIPDYSAPIKLELFNKLNVPGPADIVVFQESLLPSRDYPPKAIAWRVFTNLMDSVKFIYDQKLQVVTSDTPEAKFTDLEFGKAYKIENGEVVLDPTRPSSQQYIDIYGPAPALQASQDPLTLYFYRGGKLIGKKEILENEYFSLFDNKIISVGKVSQPVAEGQEFDFMKEHFSLLMLQNVTEGSIDVYDHTASLNPNHRVN